MLWAQIAGAALVLCALGCSRKTAPPPESAPKQAQTPPALRLPLADYIPAAGLRWLIHVRPRQLLEIPGFEAQWARLLGAERIRAFALASGAPPRSVDDLWVAGYDLGTLYVFDGRKVDAAAELAFRSRAMSSRDLTPSDGDLVHVTGMIESTPHALVRVPGHVVALAEKDTSLARLVRAFAEGKLKRAPSALKSASLSVHRDFAPTAPVRGFFVGPFVDATDVVVAGAVSGVSALTWDQNTITFTAEASGIWPRLADLSQRMSAWAAGKLDTPEMRALGLGDPQKPPQILCQFSGQASDQHPESTGSQEDPERDLVRCNARATFDAAKVADSLYRLLAAPTSEMFRPSSSTPPVEVAPHSP